MESSSENSFAWTDTSSDSAINSTIMADDNFNDHITNDDDEKIIKDKKSKKKCSDESDSIVIKEEKTYFETKNVSSVKKKHIKVEPDSENEIRKKKKKIKHLETNGGDNDSQDSLTYDESYLNMKVKQEELLTSSSTKHKKKKKREQNSSVELSTTQLKTRENNSSSEMYDDNVDNASLKEETENDIGIKKTKKKKKSKKKYDSDNHIVDMEEKMDVDETLVNNNLKGQDTDSSVIDNTVLHEGSEESGCDDISAIKCDDSHTTHSLSLIEGNHTKINCSDNLKLTNKPGSIVPGQESNEKLQAPKHRSQRISDRIRFEDDDDETNTESSHVEHESKYENNTKPSKLKQFLKNNPNLKLLPQTYNNNITVSSDDEIWILKCPKEINIQDFENTTLNIHGKCKIKVGGQSYEGSAEEEQAETISLLTIEQNKYKLRNVQLSGMVNLRKRIPKAHFRDDNIMVNNQTNFIPLPDTKCRHPLFGSNYKKAIKIPAAVAERLNVQDTEETLTAKRKKKRNKREAEHVNSQVQSEIILKTESEHFEIREKKKKKRRLIDDEGPAPKKVKRIKHDPESAEAWESEKAIEENLFNF